MRFALKLFASESPPRFSETYETPFLNDQNNETAPTEKTPQHAVVTIPDSESDSFRHTFAPPSHFQDVTDILGVIASFVEKIDLDAFSKISYRFNDAIKKQYPDLFASIPLLNFIKVNQLHTGKRLNLVIYPESQPKWMTAIALQIHGLMCGDARYRVATHLESLASMKRESTIFSLELTPEKRREILSEISDAQYHLAPAETYCKLLTMTLLIAASAASLALLMTYSWRLTLEHIDNCSWLGNCDHEYLNCERVINGNINNTWKGLPYETLLPACLGSICSFFIDAPESDNDDFSLSCNGKSEAFMLCCFLTIIVSTPLLLLTAARVFMSIDPAAEWGLRFGRNHPLLFSGAEFNTFFETLKENSAQATRVVNIDDRAESEERRSESSFAP